MKTRIIFLVGPTAVGKTDVALLLAKKINAQIISCDSMQVYRGMDIITSKPSAGLRKKVTHHLIDIVSPTFEYNVSRYRKYALRKIKDIISKGKTPLFVGGTGLYMSILVDGIFSAKSQNRALRQRLFLEAKQKGSRHLHERLTRVDPEAAEKIHPNDTKRMVRALEVFEIMGRPISELQKQREGLSSGYDIRIYCLNMERERLYKRIDERVDGMFKKGLIEEVAGLLRLRLSQTASCAIGIKELKGYFNGLYGLEEAKQLIKRNTRLYAKRQLTWFRKGKRINWVEIKEGDSFVGIAERIADSL